jgi:hypothetical protein
MGELQELMILIRREITRITGNPDLDIGEVRRELTELWDASENVSDKVS